MYRSSQMVDMESSTSSMFQKFAIAFKAKTYELFAENEDDDDVTAAGDDVTTLFNSAEGFIPDQKVVVIKPDPVHGTNSNAHLARTLVPSLLATLSSFEASYLQFQTAHVPRIDQNALEAADKSLVSVLEKLSEMKKFYYKKGAESCDFDFPAESFLEFQVQENQSKLRALETMVNSLQAQIDVKADEVVSLRKNLDKVRVFNTNLSRKLDTKKGKLEKGIEILLTIRVFEAMLNDSVRCLERFTKLLISLMEKAGWDLEEAANSVYPGAVYSKKGHFRYAFLSYVCLGMFRNFDKNDFGLLDCDVICNGNDKDCSENGLIPSEVMCNGNDVEQSENGVILNGYLKQLIEHVACNPMEILSMDPKCEFARFCEKKYEELIHPTMESSVFSSLDKKEKVLDSWKSLSVFYESFVRMASSIWLLHKLAYSFDPVVEIFRLESGVDFSMVYMEDVVRKVSIPQKTRPKVQFTVVPGFKVGSTVIQSQVYLTGLKCTE